MGKSRVIKTQHMLILFVLSVFIIFAGCFDKGNNKDTGSYTLPTGTVTGIITSAEGDPLEGALVSIGACSSLTDAQGKFTITGVPSGTGLVLTVFLEGYVNYSVTIDVNKEQTVTLNFPMAAIPPPPPPDDPDDPPGPPPPPAPGSVTGTVTDTLVNRPMKGALVTIAGLSATTAADGTYTINGVPAGNGKAVTAALGGYKNYAGTVTVVSNQAAVKDFQLIQDTGRFVTFESRSSNLAVADANNYTDVFKWDRQTGTNVCASVSDAGIIGDGDSLNSACTLDGRYIVFQSSATNLIANDNNWENDIFIRDTVANTTVRVSTGDDESESNGWSLNPSISGDSRYVVFESGATNLISGGTNGCSQIFIRDLHEGTTTLISASSGGAEGDADSYRPAISTDGRYVVFESYATNLVPGGTSGWAHIYLRNLQTNTTTLVSTATDGSEGNADSNLCSISADGRYVAFESLATNLVGGCTGGMKQIYLRDMQTGTTLQVSSAADGSEGNSFSYGPSLSADGRFVTFYSSSGNLVPGDTNNLTDVFVRDMQTGTTLRASVADDGSEGVASSNYPSISADGRYVVFKSDSCNLAENVPGLGLVYMRDTQTGHTELITKPNQSCLIGNNASEMPSVSADGRYVVFESLASNLVAGDTNYCSDIFLRDTDGNTISLVSVNVGGNQGNAVSFTPFISANGRYVAFNSKASNLVPGDTNGARDTFVRDLQMNTITRVSVSSAGVQGNSTTQEASVSADGRYAAFQSTASNLVAGDTNNRGDIFVRDLQAGTTTRASISTGSVQGNNTSDASVISSNGRYVAFRSTASNLVAGDTNNAGDIFIRDTVANTTIRASVSTGGTQGNSESGYPALSSDGRYVAFWSWASNLVAGDTNGECDIFVRDTVANTTTRVSVSSGGIQGDFSSYYPSISADGRYITFSSEATNLAAGDTNGTSDIFIRDTVGNTTVMCSKDSAGVPENRQALFSCLSTDGRYVIFSSLGSNLTPDDNNEKTDIFKRDMQAGQTTLVNPALFINIIPNENVDNPYTTYRDQSPVLTVLRFLAGGCRTGGCLAGTLQIPGFASTGLPERIQEPVPPLSGGRE